MALLDFNKKYTTRDGRKVLRLFHCPNNIKGQVILAHIIAPNTGYTVVKYYHEDGVSATGRRPQDDLVRVPVTVSRWFKTYSDGTSEGFIMGDIAYEDKPKLTLDDSDVLDVVEIKINLIAKH